MTGRGRTNSGERLLVLVALAVLVGGSAYDFHEFSTQGTATASTTMIPSTDYAEVAQSYAAYLSFLNSSETNAVQNEFSANATVSWTNFPGLSGNYTGILNIGELFGVFLTRYSPGFSISNETHTVGLRRDYLAVNSSLDFTGFSDIFGHVHGHVEASYTYARFTYGWRISRAS